MKKYVFIAVAAFACILGAIFCVTNSNGTIKVGVDGVHIQVEEEQTQLDRLIDRAGDIFDRTNK